MKTTIDIPDALYRLAKIRAAERGVTLKTLLVESLERVISGADVVLVEESGSAYAKSPAAPRIVETQVTRSAKKRATVEDLGFTLHKSGFPILNRKPGDKTVITNEMINRIREEEGI